MGSLLGRCFGADRVSDFNANGLSLAGPEQALAPTLVSHQPQPLEVQVYLLQDPNKPWPQHWFLINLKSLKSRSISCRTRTSLGPNSRAGRLANNTRFRPLHHLLASCSFF
ncbi:hypothetical protein GE061_018063 [Apolygus lucorum]|uniref:Uncharacterized protein n=1 Tax=Apolygus lucorum TaxID=248454 RepID=A0A8S9XCU5_APOLU|nr:hypothetical protein GE061_018063 [Apolygus lucorum]